MNCRLFYSMYFSGCLHKHNIKVAFIFIFKVAVLNAYNFGILNVNQQRKRGFVFKGQDEETGGLPCIPSAPVIWLGDLGRAAPCASVSSAQGGETSGSLSGHRRYGFHGHGSAGGKTGRRSECRS